MSTVSAVTNGNTLRASAVALARPRCAYRGYRT